MIDITIDNKVYTVPNRWDELSPSQYIALSKQLSIFQSGGISLDMCRVAWLQDILSLPSAKVGFCDRDDYTRNMVFMADKVDFFYYYQYDKEVIKLLPPEVRLLVRKKHPEYLAASPERTYLLRGDIVLQVDNYIDRNLLPSIQVGDGGDGGGVKGWCADSINAHDFLLCADLISQLADNSNIIDDIVELLYPQAVQGWAHELDIEVKYAVLFNFQCFSNYLFNRTRFRVLFTPSKDKKSGRSELTLNIDNLYTLSKKGYGSAIELEAITMNQYLTLLLGELIDTARTMHAYKKSAVTIAGELNVDLKYILQWLN